jgi:hypothetical protein
MRGPLRCAILLAVTAALGCGSNTSAPEPDAGPEPFTSEPDCRCAEGQECGLDSCGNQACGSCEEGIPCSNGVCMASEGDCQGQPCGTEYGDAK